MNKGLKINWDKPVAQIRTKKVSLTLTVRGAALLSAVLIGAAIINEAMKDEK